MLCLHTNRDSCPGSSTAGENALLRPQKLYKCCCMPTHTQQHGNKSAKQQENPLITYPDLLLPSHTTNLGSNGKGQTDVGS
jgi:hypothetical protein